MVSDQHHCFEQHAPAGQDRCQLTPAKLHEVYSDLFANHVRTAANHNTPDTIDFATAPGIYATGAVTAGQAGNLDSEISRAESEVRSGNVEQATELFTSGNQELNAQIKAQRDSHGSLADLDLLNRAAGDLRATLRGLANHDEGTALNYAGAAGNDLRQIGTISDNNKIARDLTLLQATLVHGSKDDKQHFADATNQELNFELDHLRHAHGSAADIDLVTRAAGDMRAVIRALNNGDSAGAEKYANAAACDISQMGGNHTTGDAATSPSSSIPTGENITTKANTSNAPSDSSTSSPPSLSPAAGDSTQPVTPTTAATDQGDSSAASSDGVLFGVYQGTGSKDAASQLGRKLGIGVAGYFPMGSSIDMSKVNDLANNGTIPEIDLAGTDKNKQITTADIVSGKEDAYLKDLAGNLKNVKGEVMLRYGWEMDGSWNKNWVGSPQEYVKAFQHIHDIFAQAGASNVKFVWTPDAQAYSQKSGSAMLASEYYPGDKYVDYVGADGYSEQYYNGKLLPYETPAQLFESGVDFAKSHDKPFLIGETGVQAGDSAAGAQYVNEMEAWIKSQPDVKALIWFNTNTKQEGTEENNWLYDSSPQELNAMRQLANDSYFKAYESQ